MLVKALLKCSVSHHSCNMLKINYFVDYAKSVSGILQKLFLKMRNGELPIYIPY